MDQKLKNLKKITKYMRENGVLNLKTPDFEISLDQSAIFPQPKKSMAQAPLEESVAPIPELSAEDILFWSSPGILYPNNEEAN